MACHIVDMLTSVRKKGTRAATQRAHPPAQFRCFGSHQFRTGGALRKKVSVAFHSGLPQRRLG